MSTRDDVSAVKGTLDVWADNQRLRDELKARDLYIAVLEHELEMHRSPKPAVIRCPNCNAEKSPTFVMEEAKRHECGSCSYVSVVVITRDGGFALEGPEQPDENRWHDEEGEDDE